MKLNSLILGCLMMCLVSCREDGKIITIYTCGFKADTLLSPGSYEGVYFKNLELNSISNPTPPDKKFGANDIMLEGEDIYILGTVSMLTEDQKKTVYWKNGVLTNLDRGAPNSEATDLFVEHGDVYVLVNDNLNAMKNMGYYKNGNYTSISSTQGKGNYGAAFFVFKDTVHVAGHEYNSDNDTTQPRYWINDSAVVLSTPAISYGEATSVFVTEDATRYVVGTVVLRGPYKINTPVFWKNGVYTPLTLSSGYIGGKASSIFVENGNVYIGGMQYDNGFNVAVTYWKNGAPVIIDSGVVYSTVQKIAVLNNNVYCIGLRDINTTAALWINGSRVNLGSAGGFTYLSGLFVKYQE